MRSRTVVCNAPLSSVNYTDCSPSSCSGIQQPSRSPSRTARTHTEPLIRVSPHRPACTTAASGIRQRVRDPLALTHTHTHTHTHRHKDTPPSAAQPMNNDERGGGTSVGGVSEHQCSNNEALLCQVTLMSHTHTHTYSQRWSDCVSCGGDFKWFLVLNCYY